MALELIVATLLWTLGLLVTLDGLLPMRSSGPNPAWSEVAIGVLIFALGILMRRRALSDSATKDLPIDDVRHKEKSWWLSGPPMPRRLVWVSILLACIGAWWAWEPLLYYRFDSQSWLAAKPERRYYMARYLIEKSDIKQWTREQVLERLGPPAHDSTDAVFYDLGHERGSWIIIDGSVFIIHFDLHGRITSAGICTT